MRTLYLLSNDLRLDDNPALRLSAQSEQLVLVYVVDPAWFRVNQYGAVSMGTHRWQFIKQALLDLDNELRALGQQLWVIEGEPIETVSRLIQQNQIQRVVSSQQFGSDENNRLAEIQRQNQSLRFDTVDTYTLFDRQSLPMSVEDIPETYSRFRRKAEKATPPTAIAAPRKLPAKLSLDSESNLLTQWTDIEETESQFNGGETAARKHVDTYFSGELPLSYKLVRNELDGWENSSKMSAWLNSGCLSARRLLNQIHSYELCRERNDSTYWLYIELLWREYFQWLALNIGKTLFARDGNAEHAYTGNYDAQGLAAWCEGNTDYPLVNACMRQLNATGFLSNRGRQIAASCLINELRGDWRYGAAWFEQQLVDYDVAANWGNWQYIAGVGADARGGRHFNLAKQTEIYDGDGSYRHRWLGS